MTQGYDQERLRVALDAVESAAATSRGILFPTGYSTASRTSAQRRGAWWNN